MATPKKGVSMMQEENNGVELEAGLYRHPQTGEELVTKSDPLWGNAQSEAVVRVGFEYVGPAPKDYEKTLPELNAAQQLNKDTEDLKGIQARLNALEYEKAVAEATQSVDSSVPGADLAKNNAARAVEARGQGDAGEVAAPDEAQPLAAELKQEGNVNEAATSEPQAPKGSDKKGSNK
jgi:hypothetical protein